MKLVLTEKEETYTKIDAQWKGLGGVWFDYDNDFKTIVEAKKFIEDEKKVSFSQEFRVVEITKTKKVI